jgi:hypothetical protein
MQQRHCDARINGNIISSRGFWTRLMASFTMPEPTGDEVRRGILYAARSGG